MESHLSLSRTTSINEGVILFHYLIKNFPFKVGMNFIWVDFPNGNLSGRCAVFQSKSPPNFVNRPFFRPWDDDFIHVGWIGPQDKIILPWSHRNRAFDRQGAYPCQDYHMDERHSSFVTQLKSDLRDYGLSNQRIDALTDGVVTRFKKFEDE